MKHDALNRYVELTQWIRELSAPNIADISSSEEYRVNLLRSFMRIVELAQMNESILNEHIYPLLEPDRDLSKEDIETIREFCSILMDPTSMENVDLPLINLQTQKLVEVAESKDDVYLRIIALDLLVMSSYTMFTTTYRLYPYYDICIKYREAGIAAAKELIGYLDKDKFAKLPDDYTKETVLVNSRYISSLFVWFDQEIDYEARQEDIDILERSLALADDPFYLEHAPNYDWTYHKFRALEYLACYTEGVNSNHYSDAQLEKIAEHTKALIKLIKEEKINTDDELPKNAQDLYLYRNLYLSKKISLEAYKKELRNIFDRQDKNKYSAIDIYVFFTTAIEYLTVVDKNDLSKDDKSFLRNFYNIMPSYVYRLPSSGQLSFVITFISDVFKAFVEIEEAQSFKTLCLELMAALHPPTYVHTLSVADFATCITNHLINKDPARLIGLFGYENVNEVKQHKNEILDYIRSSALLHDVGKLFIIETIMTYSRRLFPSEFDVIKAHPIIGAVMLSKHNSTKAYINGAFGHHKWANNKDGYPPEFDLNSANDNVLISILSIADCLDAATDTVGRNYKQSKELDTYIRELEDGRGTRYVDYLVDLIKDEQLYNEIELLLENNRDENYRKTYRLLKEL